MNVPVIDRSRLACAIESVERRFALTIAGALPAGVIGHPSGLEPVVFLADSKRGLSLLDVCSAEVEMEDRLGVPARILLRSEFNDESGRAILERLRPL